MTELIQPPSRSGLVREARGILEFPRLLFRLPALARQPRGRGEPVFVVPGYGAGDVSTLMLQSYLRYLGYRVRGSGLGATSGDVPERLVRVLRILVYFAHQARQPVRIVGWSLGGYLAREAARERPDLVQQVITLGTPVVGGPKYTVLARGLRHRGIDVDAIEAEIESRNRTSLTTPVTAIYSRGDAVVAWEACIDRHGLDVEHVEVGTTHLGFGFSPEVYRIIAQRLANGSAQSHQWSRPKPGRWRHGWAPRAAKS
jgi:pimeloyl-ACP methyl ester carboxylesterase